MKHKKLEKLNLFENLPKSRYCAWCLFLFPSLTGEMGIYYIMR